MLTAVPLGTTSVILRVVLQDSSSTTGAGLTGLTSASAGLIIGTIADSEATTTRYRASSSEVETITTLGTYATPTSGKCRFKEVDSTNHPGLYEIQLADARFAAGKSLTVTLSGATNLKQCNNLIVLSLPVDVRAWVGTAQSVPSNSLPDVNVLLFDGSNPATAITNATLDLTDGVETGVTAREALRAIASGIAGKVTVTGGAYAAIGNTGTPRLVVSDDGNGNRSVTLSLT